MGAMALMLDFENEIDRALLPESVKLADPVPPEERAQRLSDDINSALPFMLDNTFTSPEDVFDRHEQTKA